jgi:hypothetical protein
MRSMYMARSLDRGFMVAPVTVGVPGASNGFAADGRATLFKVRIENISSPPRRLGGRRHRGESGTGHRSRPGPAAKGPKHRHGRKRRGAVGAGPITINTCTPFMMSI